MRGYRAFARYRRQQPFGPWIRAIAANHCIDVLRQHARLTDVFADEPDAAAWSADPSDNGVAGVVAQRDAAAVVRAVDALPEKYRLPIVLAYYADASYDEIAAALGTTRNHVGVLLMRGRQRLRHELADFDEENHQ